MKVKLNHPIHGRILTLKGKRSTILKQAATYLVKHYPDAVANIASVSGGMASSVAARRLVEKEGPANCIQWYADTRYEDEDTYRYLTETRDKLATLVIIYTDGRTPVNIWDQNQMIPSNFAAPCSKQLKIIPIVMFIRALCKALIKRNGLGNQVRLKENIPTLVKNAVGMDWREMHRMAAPQAAFDTIPGAKVIFPLMWPPYEQNGYYEVVKSWGVQPPRAYDLGFDHNNCGFRCCRQGQKSWKKLNSIMPDRFREVMEWERARTSQNNPRKGRAMLTRTVKGKREFLPLYKLIDESIEVATNPDKDDRTNCYCTY